MIKSWATSFSVELTLGRSEIKKIEYYLSLIVIPVQLDFVSLGINSLLLLILIHYNSEQSSDFTCIC